MTHDDAQQPTAETNVGESRPSRRKVRARFRELFDRASAMNHTMELLLIPGDVLDSQPFDMTVMRMPLTVGADHGDIDSILDHVEEYLASPTATKLSDLVAERKRIMGRLERQTSEHNRTIGHLEDIDRAIQGEAHELHVQVSGGDPSVVDSFEAFLREAVSRAGGSVQEAQAQTPGR